MIDAHKLILLHKKTIRQAIIMGYCNSRSLLYSPKLAIKSKESLNAIPSVGSLSKESLSGISNLGSLLKESLSGISKLVSSERKSLNDLSKLGSLPKESLNAISNVGSLSKESLSGISKEITLFQASRKEGKFFVCQLNYLILPEINNSFPNEKNINLSFYQPVTDCTG